MEFYRGKCTMFIRRSGKIQFTEGKEMPNQERIKTLGEQECYQYSGNVRQVEMKEKDGKRNDNDTQGFTSDR